MSSQLGFWLSKRIGISSLHGYFNCRRWTSHLSKRVHIKKRKRAGYLYFLVWVYDVTIVMSRHVMIGMIYLYETE